MNDSEFLEVTSPSALKNLQALNAEIVKTIAGVKEVNANMISIKTPSGSDSAIKKLTADYDANAKAISNVQIQLEKLAQAQNRTKISNNAVEKSNLSLEASIERKNKALDREQAKLTAAQNLYNKVQAKLNTLSNEYKNLAVQKELTGKLTNDEAKRYDFLLGKITKYDTTLKAVDATMGKHQRNVGNYAGAFNPLSNSINQLTREMPAFANSVQTGFMAISNNLPIFFDAISQARNEIKLLREQGQAAPSMFDKLKGSILSWGTALSIGVTLLTVFGDEIVDSILGTKAKAKADEEAKKATDAKNEADQKYLDTIRNTGGEEIARSQLLFENAKNVNLSMKDRLKAIDDLRERYPDYLKQLSNEQILAGNTADAENALNDALVKRGVAIGLQTKLTDEYNKLAEVLLKINNVERQKITIDKETLANAKALGISASQLTKDRELLAKLAIVNFAKEKKALKKTSNRY